MPDALTPQSPEWWIERLYKRLVARREQIDFFDDYYTGNHPLPWLSQQAREEFLRMVQMTRSNYMGLVVDSTGERLAVEGFRFGDDATADRDSWRIWQANNLDSDSDMAWLEALITGVSYFHVAPNEQDASTPNIWVEHPSQAIVEHLPGTNRRVRAASLKVWDDDWTGEIHATLQTPGFLYKFKAPRPSGGVTTSLRWVEREVLKEQPNGQRRNPLGAVSMVEVANNPRLLSGGQSELYDVTDIQDRINKTLFDRMQTQEFGVDPQKWAKAFPKEDADGNPQTIEFGRNRMVTTDVAETQFGNFAVAALSPYSEAKREDVKDIASRTRTPAQYLLGEMSNVNGETLKASESGLISKVKQRQRPFGEAAEEAMRLARRAANLSGAADARMETLWVDPQYRTEGERTDAIVKRLQAGISSLRQAREDYGYTATEIERLEADDKTSALDPVTRAIVDGLGNDAAIGA
ncbi:phage portal protein [Nocardioides kribbensis]|uniref:Phage portal protein n=1 Tax=Nocardioides kribbensis TaxID=305517 RepID=A0ABV1NYY3_9ACTN